MNTQPEALRLADVLEGRPGVDTLWVASIELRRLYAENANLTEQRDQLIKCLETAISTIGYYASVCNEDDQPTPAKEARSAIAKVKGEN
jgi:hypothetical protein